MPYLKSQVSFSLNFASPFSLMRDNSSVLFKLKFYMIFTKVTHVSAQFQIFDCSGEILPNFYFDRLLLLKVYKISAKKVQRSYVSMLKSDAKFEEKPICCLKNDKNLVNFDPSTQKSQKFAFWLAPFVQSCNVWPEKVQGSYLSWRWKSTQNLKKNWLWFGKWPEEFSKFSSKHLKVSKLVLSRDSFVQSRKCMSKMRSYV